MRSSSLSFSLSLSSSSCTHAREENLRHTRCDDNRRMRFKRNGNFAYDGVNVIEGIEILLLLVRVRRRARVKSLRRPERGREEKKKKENIPIRGKKTGRLNEIAISFARTGKLVAEGKNGLSGVPVRPVSTIRHQPAEFLPFPVHFLLATVRMVVKGLLQEFLLSRLTRHCSTRLLGNLAANSDRERELAIVYVAAR